MDGPILYPHGPPLVATHTAPDLRAPICGTGSGQGFLLCVAQTGSKQSEGRLLVLRLTAFGFAADGDAGRSMCDLDGRFGLVDLLAAATACTAGLHLDVPFVDADLSLGRLREHSDRDRTGLHSTAFLGGRNPLPPMAPGFVPKDFVGVFSDDTKDDVARKLLYNLDVKDTSAPPPSRRS